MSKYGHFLLVTRIKDVINKPIEIFDSTTVSLLHDILKCVGRIKDKAVYNFTEQRQIEQHNHSGVLEDALIEISAN